MKKVIYLMVIIPVLMFANYDQNTLIEVDSIISSSSSKKKINPITFAKSKFVDAISCTTKAELESVIISFDELLTIVRATGDIGKEKALEISKEENVRTRFYDHFISDSFNHLQGIDPNCASEFDFVLSKKMNKMNLTFYEITVTNAFGVKLIMEIAKADGILYMGQFRK